MPGIISTNIAANSIRWNPKPGRVPSEELLEKAAQEKLLKPAVQVNDL